MNTKVLFILLFLGISTGAYSQVPPVVEASNQSVRSTVLTQKFLTPTRIVWKSDETGKQVLNAE
ncbi:MAG: hypothetical protein ACK5HT_02085, partial [Draconibacterium sp.]